MNHYKQPKNNQYKSTFFPRIFCLFKCMMQGYILLFFSENFLYNALSKLIKS